MVEYHDNYDTTDNIKNKGKKIDSDLQSYLNSPANFPILNQNSDDSSRKRRAIAEIIVYGPIFIICKIMLLTYYIAFFGSLFFFLFYCILRKDFLQRNPFVIVPPCVTLKH